jgi:hypothetical protein
LCRQEYSVSQIQIDNFIWSLVSVYGAAQDIFKADFLRELVNLAKDDPYPILIGGYFNLLRFRKVKILSMLTGISCLMLSSIVRLERG